MTLGEKVIAGLLVIIIYLILAGQHDARKQRERIFNLIHTIRIHLTGK